MKRLVAASIFVLVTLFAFGVSAQDTDARVATAVELFQAGKFVDAAKLFEEIDREQPANYLLLNAMVSWYKADRCVEARDAMARIVDDSTLEPPDRQDIDKIGAYCTLKDSREQARAGDIDKALVTLEGLQTQDVGLQQEIVSFRTELEQKKKADAEADTAARPEPTPSPEIEPAPNPAPRPRWALWSGLALTGTGVALAIGTAAKAYSDENEFDEGMQGFADAYGCGYNDKTDQFENCPGEADLRGTNEFTSWMDDVDLAHTATAAMGVSAGVVGLTGLGVLTYYWLQRGDSDRQAFNIVPTLGRDGVGAVMELRF